ncbi:PEP-CTERM sorting domain-containing protein [Desulfovibrio caledoniensis]
MKPAFRVLFAFILTLALCAPAMAEVITFYGDDQGATLTPAGAEAQFQSNLSSVFIEDFSSGTTIDFGNGITATANTGSVANERWHLYNRPLTLTFSQAINAFGTYIIDVDQGSDLSFFYNDSELDIPHQVVAGGLNNDVHFWGIIDTEALFTQITFTGITWYIDWDNMQIGTPDVQHSSPVATPEPSTFLLLAAGLGGIAFLRRKRA